MALVLKGFWPKEAILNQDGVIFSSPDVEISWLHYIDTFRVLFVIVSSKS
jgi:hypothetical protein